MTEDRKLAQRLAQILSKEPGFIEIMYEFHGMVILVTKSSIPDEKGQN